MPTTFKQLVQKMVDDQDFRAEMFSNPEGALISVGIEPTAELVQAINDVDQDSINDVLQLVNIGATNFLVT